MLYRAHVYSLIASRDEGEFTVLFESYRSNPTEALHKLVAAAWDVPLGAVESYNCHSEPELRTMWGDAADVATRGADRDAVLLQIGDGPDGPRFQCAARTVLLCTPRWHVRLVAAQEHIQREQRLRCGRQLMADARLQAQRINPGPPVLRRMPATQHAGVPA